MLIRKFLLAFAFFMLSMPWALGQRTLTGPVKGFRFPDYYGAESSTPNRIKSLLMGQEALPLSNGTIQVKGLRLENYLADGKTNLVVESPECLFDPKGKSVGSAGALKVASGDGLLSIQGRSFLYLMTQASLVISNRPRTVIQQEQKIEVDADNFEYQSNTVHYAGGVKMRDAELEMAADSVWIQLSASTNLPLAGVANSPVKTANAVQSVIAEKNVEILNKKEDTRLSGDRAEYKTIDGLEIIQITGQPAWRQKERRGTADVIQLERKSKTFNLFQALGHAVTRLPGVDLKTQLTLIPNVQTQTNTTAQASESIEILSDSFQLRENGAAFEGQVRMAEKPESDSSSKAACDRLLLENISPKGDYGSLIMDGHVALTQGKSQAFGQKLVYNATNSIAELTGEPRWSMGAHSGSAGILRFHSGEQWIEAMDHAKMNILATEDILSSLAMAAKAATNSAVTNKSVTIESARYDLKPGSVAFQGGVLLKSVQEGADMGRMQAEQLFVRMSIPGNKLEQLTAQNYVVIEHGTPGVTNGPSAFQQVKCAKITAEAKEGQVVNMVAEGGVAWHHPQMDASGEQLVYIAAQDAFVLMGNPVVKSARGTMLGQLRGPVMIFDRKEQKFHLRSWSFRATLK
jgi:lipopolysaccharide export system protein LptA